jgi:hypothetical protein
VLEERELLVTVQPLGMGPVVSLVYFNLSVGAGQAQMDMEFSPTKIICHAGIGEMQRPAKSLGRRHRNLI